MIKRIKKIMLIGAITFGFTLPVFVATSSSAQIDQGSKDAACAGLGAAGQDCSGANAGSSVRNLLRTIISILSWAVGIIAIIMMIVGGLKFITANGDSNAINSARSTITYALVGVVVAALSQVLVQFVLREATAANSGPSAAECEQLPQSEQQAIGC